MIISIGKLVKKKSLTGVYVLAIQSKQSRITGVMSKKKMALENRERRRKQ
jgi:hypothetical protein